VVERTGELVLKILWSYVDDILSQYIYILFTLAYPSLLNTNTVFWEVVLAVIERGGPRGTWPASRAPPEALPKAFFGGCARLFIVVM
jgi:hypothetical protein